ncbi:MAG TPA: hypothetical protein VFE34_26805 [Dongiaceae bacterium]|jgi:hypothetical protein|nr:hypothetical protein [Dongiaceae bacterium]
MTDPCITVTGISAVRPDCEHDVVHIDCSAEQHAATLDLHRGVLGTLVLSLLQAAQAFPDDESEEYLGQPLQLTGVGVVSFEAGTFALELLLDEGLRVVVALPDGGIAAMRQCLDGIATLRHALAGEPSGMTQH